MIELAFSAAVYTSAGEIIYNKPEKAFDFLPQANSDITLLVGYINIGFDSRSMTANQIWGFSPYDSWTVKKLYVPTKYGKGSLALVGDLQPGLSWRIDGGDNLWRSYYDKSTRWFCIGNPLDITAVPAVEFLPGAVGTICNNLLTSLWIWIKSSIDP